MKISRFFKKNTIIGIITVFGILSRIHADINESIVIDEAFYRENPYVIPPRIIKKTDVDGYYEIQIAPANKEGVSYNFFQKIDMTALEGALFVNTLVKDSAVSEGNQNFKFSQTDNQKAKTIYIEITDQGLLSETYLHGLVQVVGDRADVIVKGDKDIIINGAFFRNIENFYLTQNEGNIRIKAEGMHADSPVIFNSKHVHIEGPIHIPNKTLFFDVQGGCTFHEKGRIEELGVLEAVCNESFINHGNLKIQGQARITTGEFTNEALYGMTPWEQGMIGVLDPGKQIMQVDHGFITTDGSALGRKYEKQLDNSGIISASNYFINITQSSFQNINGAQIYATKDNSPSQIVAKGAITNIYKHRLTEEGLSKNGFDYVPSIMDFAGNAILYSELGQIKNHGSTINFRAHGAVRAGTDILNINAAGQFLALKHCISIKCCPKICFPDIYTPRNVPGIITVQGSEAYRKALGDITEIGSLYATAGASFDKHVGKHIIKAVTIDPKSEQGAVERLSDIYAGKFANSLIPKHAGTAVGSPSWSWGRIGGNYHGGLATVETEGGLEILDGGEYVAKGLDLKSKNDVSLIGIGESYIDQIINTKNERMLTHGFKMHPSFMKIDGPFKVFITEGSLNLNGAIIVFSGDGTIDSPKMSLVPLTLLAEDFYYKRKNNFFNKAEVSIWKSTAGTIQSGIQGGGHLELNVGHLSSEGGVIQGKEGTTFNVDTLDLKAHIINHYLIKKTKSSGISFPGVANALKDVLNNDFSSRSITGNIPIAGTLDRLFNTKSASDMAPSISAIVEAYTMADQFSTTYLATGSEMAAMTSVALDQLNLMMVGGIPVPSAISFGTKKTHRELKWHSALESKVGGAYIKVNAQKVDANGAIFEADKDIEFNIAGDLHLNAQSLAASEKFREEGKYLTLAFNNKGISTSAGGHIAKSNSQMVRQLMPKILAGESVTINVGGDAKVEGEIASPKVKIKVGGELFLKTVQDKEEGRSSEKSGNIGVSISSEGVMPTGGFGLGKGHWLRNWANQQAGIFGKEIEIDVEKLILEGAAILGKMGYVNAESIEFKNLQNVYESEFSEFGFDTNFLTFLINPRNAPRVVSAANAIKGMVSFGNEEDEAYQTLLATISKDIELNTASNIDGLNREDSKAQGPVRHSSHKFSLAIPIVDWKQLGEGLDRIGMAAKDINQKMQDTFERAKQTVVGPEELAKIEEVEDKYNDIVEKIEKAEISEAEKAELLTRMIFIMGGDEVGGKKYMVFAEGKKTYSSDGTTLEKEQIRVEAVEMKDGTENVYKTSDGVLLGSVDSEGDYDRFSLLISNDLVNDIKELKSSKFKSEAAGSWNWNEAFFAGKLGIRIVPVNLEGVIKEGYIKIGQVNIDPVDIDTSQKDFDWDNFERMRTQAAEQFLSELWSGVKMTANVAGETWNTPRVQGSVEVVFGVGEVITGASLAATTFETGIGFYAGLALATHGLDTARKGFGQVLTDEEWETLTVQAIELTGLSNHIAKNIETILFGSVFIAATRQLLIEGVETAVKVAGKQVKENASGGTAAETCPREIGLAKRDLCTTTNPLNLKQIPASLAKEFEGGGSWIMTEEDYLTHFLPKSLIGRTDGQFMVSNKAMNKALAEANGNVVKLQELLSTNQWDGKILYRLDFKNPLDYNPRVPHQGLSGANEHFVPGGLTKGGVSEIITDQLPKNKITVTKLN